MKPDGELLIYHQIKHNIFEESFAGNSSCFAISTNSSQETRQPLPSQQTPEPEAKKPLHDFEKESRSLDEKNKEIIETTFQRQRGGKEWTSEQRDTSFYAMLQFGESCER